MSVLSTLWNYITYFHGLFFEFVEFSLRYLDKMNNIPTSEIEHDNSYKNE